MMDARNSVRLGFQNVIASRIFVLVGLLVATLPAAAHPEMLIQIEEVTGQIAADPSNAQLYLKRGDLYRDHGDWPSARADFDRAKALDSGLRLLDFSVGRTWLESGQPKEALPFLNRFLGREPDHAEALILRGRAHAGLGEPLAAASDFNRAIEVRLRGGNIPPPEMFLERARAQTAAGGQHRQEALAGLQQGLELLGGPITLEIEALTVELGLDRLDDALRRVDRLAATAARPEPWLVRRGEILERAGRLAESRRSYLAALDAIAALPPPRRSAGNVPSLELQARNALQRIPDTNARVGGAK